MYTRWGRGEGALEELVFIWGNSLKGKYVRAYRENIGVYGSIRKKCIRESFDRRNFPKGSLAMGNFCQRFFHGQLSMGELSGHRYIHADGFLISRDSKINSSERC